ncbi:MAG: 16S rRNA (uracil(1498)-N(3))-methyltransferase, partial [Halarsenatibacteraceae bacterium]
SEGEIVPIAGELYNHIFNSLRHQSGDRILLLDGQGLKYEVEILEVGQKSAECRIESIGKTAGEPQLQIFIAQAIAKKDNFEYVLQKSTEIGAVGFYPLETARTVVKIKESKKEKKLNRWQKIVKEAARQSERGEIPEIYDPVDLNKLRECFSEFDAILIARARDEARSLKEVVNKLEANSEYEDLRILVLVGPEGGFTDSEIKEVLSADNVYGFNLGPRILRTETVAPLVTGLILYEQGEI